MTAKRAARAAKPASRRELPADLPARSAEEATRRLALVELARAGTAREALVAGDRDEALHDFRVALRRLRSLLRAHRREFSLDFPKKELKRVAALARATNPGRDAEVQVAWLATLEPALKPAERAGHAELVRQLTERRDDAYRQVEREIVRDFGELAGALGERLVKFRVELRLDRSTKARSFAAASREALGAALAELHQRLEAVRTVADESDGHAARIAAKRLRYLAEPLAPWAAEAREPVARLKALQDLLGELHDGQILAAHVAASLAELESRRAHLLIEATLEEGGEAGTNAGEEGGGSAADGKRGNRGELAARRRLKPGLLAVARALGERRSALFSALASGWLGSPAESAPELAALDAAVAQLAERLAAPASSWRHRTAKR